MPIFAARRACRVRHRAGGRRFGSMRTKLAGSIINISLADGRVGAARRSVYCASKHAIEGFTKAMAIELAPHNIRVNSLGPTSIEAPMTRPYFENRAIPRRSAGEDQASAASASWTGHRGHRLLASDASSLMTGGSTRSRRRLRLLSEPHGARRCSAERHRDSSESDEEIGILLREETRKLRDAFSRGGFSASRRNGMSLPNFVPLCTRWLPEIGEHAIQLVS